MCWRYEVIAVIPFIPMFRKFMLFAMTHSYRVPEIEVRRIYNEAHEKKLLPVNNEPLFAFKCLKREILSQSPHQIIAIGAAISTW